MIYQKKRGKKKIHCAEDRKTKQKKNQNIANDKRHHEKDAVLDLNPYKVRERSLREGCNTEEQTLRPVA